MGREYEFWERKGERGELMRKGRMEGVRKSG